MNATLSSGFAEGASPAVDWAQLSPLLVVLGAALVGVLVEAFVPRERRRVLQAGISLVGFVGAALASVLVGLDLPEQGSTTGILTGAGTVAVDGPAVFTWVLLLAIGALSVLLFAETRLEGGVTAFAGQAAAAPGSTGEREAANRGLAHTEVYPLLGFAVFGMMLFASANDLVTLFVALEILSLPLYLLCGLARRRRLLSQEAALKYFLLGAFSSGILLYGAALVYGYAGSLEYGRIAEVVAADTENDAMLALGLGLLLVGLLFKVGAAPFQAWVPDVYTGAPSPVTAFMAAATKVAAFVALVRLLYVAFEPAAWTWQPVIGVVAVFSMVAGTLMAITQSDVKRILAYSAVAHTGFLLVGVMGLVADEDLAPGELTSLQAVFFYLVAYSATVVGAFAVITWVRDSSGEITQLDRWAGLGRRAPLLSGVFAVLLLAMAGIPLTSGFIGKWGVFAAALADDQWLVVAVAVATSVAAIALYLRVVVVMWFREPGTAPAPVQIPSWGGVTVLAVSVVVTVLLGVLPGPVLDIAANVGQFIR